MTWVDVLNSAWFSLGATIFFGCLSVYFFLKSRGHRRIVWTYALASLQTKTHPDVEISFRGDRITNLTRLLVLCWNDGTKEIRPTDIPSAGHPGIVFDQRVRVLSLSVVGMSVQESGFSAALKGEHKVEVSFEFLNPGDGGLVEVLFEDVAEIAPAFSFVAPLVGGRNSAVRRYLPGRSAWDRLFVTVAPLALAIGAVVVFVQEGRKLLGPPGLPVKELPYLLGAALVVLIGGRVLEQWP